VGASAAKVYFVNGESHSKRSVMVEEVVLVPDMQSVDAKLYTVEQTEC